MTISGNICFISWCHCKGPFVKQKKKKVLRKSDGPNAKVNQKYTTWEGTEDIELILYEIVACVLRYWFFSFLISKTWKNKEKNHNLNVPCVLIF